MIGKLSALWVQIYDEYIRRYGLTESYLNIIQKKKELAYKKIQYITTGDRYYLTFVEIAKLELEKMQNEMQGGDFFQTKASVERNIGFAIDPMRVSVAEFYAYISELKKTPQNGRK